MTSAALRSGKLLATDGAATSSTTPVPAMGIHEGFGPGLRALPQVRPASNPAGTSAASGVADDIAVLARADEALAVGLDQIAASRTPVCAATVRRLEQLLAVIRDGACARVRLQRLDPDLLRAGVDLWLAGGGRQTQPERGVRVAL